MAVDVCVRKRGWWLGAWAGVKTEAALRQLVMPEVKLSEVPERNCAMQIQG